MKWDSLLNDGFNSIAGAVSGGLDSCTAVSYTHLRAHET